MRRCVGCPITLAAGRRSLLFILCYVVTAFVVRLVLSFRQCFYSSPLPTCLLLYLLLSTAAKPLNSDHDILHHIFQIKAKRLFKRTEVPSKCGLSDSESSESDAELFQWDGESVQLDGGSFQSYGKSSRSDFDIHKGSQLFRTGLTVVASKQEDEAFIPHPTLDGGHDCDF